MRRARESFTVRRGKVRLGKRREERKRRKKNCFTPLYGKKLVE